MTDTELTDRLREAIVLDGPDAWRSNGYLQEAQQAGLTLEAALKRANEVTQEIHNNSILFQNIHARIARLAQPSRSHLINQDLAQIVNAATSLNLSPDFVRNRWVPAVLAKLAGTSAPAPQPTESVTPASSQANTFEELIETEPEPIPAAPERRIDGPAPSVETPQTPPPTPEPVAVVPPSRPEPVVVRTSAPIQLPEPPPPLVRRYTATPARIRKGETVTLEWDVENLLAVTIDDLGEGMSPKNRGWVKPNKTTDYTLFDVNNNPLSTVRVEVIQPDRSGIYGVLFALAILALIYWFIKSNNEPVNDPAPARRERTTNRSTSMTSGVSQQQAYNKDAREPNNTDEPVATTTEPTTETVTTATDKVEEPQKKQQSEKKPAPEPEVKPSTPADARIGKYEEAFGDKPYDKIELGSDERGWRRARSNGRWGFINQDDEWVIQPEYEAVTPFRGNTASAFLNGQLLKINRDGEQIRN
ncbi:WG repeat-containing protein [Spirosoma soli]|uniref:WG repeat-containing protein n=1 Tax=Spirosoma soli TaxID=1770529 RepID=A0ABW5M9U2_9BACT